MARAVLMQNTTGDSQGTLNVHGFITRGKMHHSPEESSLSVLESKTEKRVTFKFERPRQRNQTLVRKTYGKKRLQETRDDLPETEPNGSKIFHLMNYVQTGRSFHSVRWLEKTVTKKRRQRGKTKVVCPAMQNIKEVNASDQVTYSSHDVQRRLKSEHSIMPCSDDRHMSKIEQGSINR